ncbi:MAG: helix-turn-helix transcriptional regulator [Flavobacteriales bacterium]|nr:helix-turn-helix transcriptional regulator [Flavobacteriales bacterium]
MNFGQRLKELRTQKNMTKMELSEIADVHHVQIGRYENKGAMPSADVLAKLANALSVTTEYLLNGTKEDLANQTLEDKELLNQFKSIEKFSIERKKIIKELIDAFILKTNLQKQLSI